MNLIPGPVSKNPSLIQRKSVQDHSGLDDENLLFSPSCHFCFGERTISKKKKEEEVTLMAGNWEAITRD